MAAMSDLSDRLRKKFIVIDGPDGSGKTTQIGLLAKYLADSGCDIETLVDPGTTPIGEQIRGILLNRDNGIGQCTRDSNGGTLL